MPKQHRWIIKRHLDQACNNVDRAVDDLVIAGHEFENVHPEYYLAFCMAVSNLQSMQIALRELKDLI